MWREAQRCFNDGFYDVGAGYLKNLFFINRRCAPLTQAMPDAYTAL